MAVGIARMPIKPVSFPIAESLCVAAWHPVSGSNLPLLDDGFAPKNKSILTLFVSVSLEKNNTDPIKGTSI